jgi:hypothetical protein
MYPGRHFVKDLMLLTFARLTSAFEFQLQTPRGQKPKVDMDHFGFGILPPRENAPSVIEEEVLFVRSRTKSYQSSFSSTTIYRL